jgi:hypothetical protein
MTMRTWTIATLSLCGLSLRTQACLDAQAALTETPLPRASTEELGGADRYLALVSTDKPIYRIGENVYVRVVVLDARSHKPFPASIWATLEIVGPKGETIISGNLSGDKDALGLAWPVPEGVAGGEYTARVSFPNLGFPPAERKFDVRVFRPPRLKSQIEFARDGYGPGDHVTATLHTERAEGGFPVKAKVTVSARVDDAEVARDVTRVDSSGNATASFDLPKAISRGEGTLAMAIEDGGVVETATKTIPILLQTIDLAMYPEGGDLVVGLASRVYLEAKTPAQKPADLEAAVVDERGSEIAAFATEHEGRGRFTLTPQAGHTYALKIVKPHGIARTFPLPAAKKDGAVLACATDIIAKGEPARFTVASTEVGTLTLTLSQREAEVGRASVDIGKGGWFSRGPRVGEPTTMSIPLAAEVDGVLIATLWNQANHPLAERLVFRAPAKTLHVAVKADHESYVPGGVAKLTIITSDDGGKPVGAVVGLTVTDESVLEMIEKREQAPRLLPMAFLENEVKELGDAHVYLDPKNPKAPVATDLLLGTQGWRRFALMSLTQFLAEHGDQARRALAVRVMPARPHHARNREMIEEEAIRGEAVPMVAMAPPLPAVAAEERPAAPPKAPMVENDRVRGPQPLPQKPMAMPKGDLAAVATVAAPAAAPEDKAKKMVVQKELVAQAVAAGDMKRRQGRLMAGGRALARNKAEMAEDELQAAPQPTFVYVREYSHAVRPERKPSDRVDFAETLYWSAGVATDPKTGQATISFGLSDAVTAFRVMADGFAANGDLGMATESIKSVEPFYLEPKVPLQLTSSDHVDLPVALVNATTSDMQNVALRTTVAKGIVVTGGDDKVFVKANGRKRKLVGLDTQGYVGTSELVVEANAGNYADKVTRSLEVKPLGFPIEVAQGGLLEADSVSHLTIEIPQQIVSGSLTTEIGVFPTPLGNLTQALTSLMQEPSGCFEQTSSTNYPLTMAQQYFTTHTGVDPKIVRESHEMLAHGYQRLTSFECKNHGYEWFGGASPGHEALTAYGLMEFADMRKAKLRMVDEPMVERTRQWLFKRRDGKGGFLRNPEALDSFGGAPAPTTNAYIVWALVQAGEPGLDKEVAALKKSAFSGDSYIIALAANVAAATGDMPTARALMAKLAQKQGKTGAVTGADTSITQSGGEALSIETTSLALLAWLTESQFAAQAEQAFRFLASECQGGRFASTQSTVLALKSIVAYDMARAKTKAGGSIQVIVDGSPVGSAVAFTASAEGTISLPSIVGQLTSGKHTIDLKMEKGARMPFTFAARYNALTPASSVETKLTLATDLHGTKVREGDTTEIRVDVANITDKDAAMPVAIVGIPGGLEVRHDQLKELVKSGKVDAYEVRGREVILYWRQIKAKRSVSLPLSVVAAIPGRYTAPASRVYEYYTDEHKRWVDGVAVEILPLSAQ